MKTIDKHTRKIIETRASWVRQAVFEKAFRDGLLRRDPAPVDVLELDRVLG